MIVSCWHYPTSCTPLRSPSHSNMKQHITHIHHSGKFWLCCWDWVLLMCPCNLPNDFDKQLSKGFCLPCGGSKIGCPRPHGFTHPTSGGKYSWVTYTYSQTRPKTKSVCGENIQGQHESFLLVNIMHGFVCWLIILTIYWRFIKNLISD